jgi:hypothetical protein
VGELKQLKHVVSLVRADDVLHLCALAKIKTTSSEP